MDTVPPLIDESDGFQPFSPAKKLPKSDAYVAMPVGLSSASNLGDTSQDKGTMIINVQTQTAIVLGGTFGTDYPSSLWRPQQPGCVTLQLLFEDCFRGTYRYDILNWPECNLADDAVWEELLHPVAADEYAACIACPMCCTFSTL